MNSSRHLPSGSWHDDVERSRCQKGWWRGTGKAFSFATSLIDIRQKEALKVRDDGNAKAKSIDGPSVALMLMQFYQEVRQVSTW